MKHIFDMFGVMVDMSRNAVMNLKRLKEFMVILKDMGYNAIMLYTEDTYEVDGEPYLGYMRGRYSKAEMKEINAFGAELGMEVIPCIQALAHMNAALKWGQYLIDCADILLTDNDRIYELIDHMFATLSECYTTRKIHIGMDEALMLGRGKHLDIHGYETVSTIMKRHLARVCEIAGKYGYEVMMWSDMFFRSWNNGEYYISKCEMPRNVVESIPKNVTPVYWDYYPREETVYRGMIENHKQLSEKTCYSGGAWCWKGLIPYNSFTIKGMTTAIEACRKENVRNFFVTLWGDDGAEGSKFSVLPSLFWMAERAKGNTDAQNIKEKFAKKYGMDFDDFVSLDDPNQVVPYDDGRTRNPSKYMLFADCLNDFLDYTVKPEAGVHFARCAKKYHELAKKSRRWGYIFDSAAKLCDALEIKYELGLRTRMAYEREDREALRMLATNEYPEVIRRIRIYAEALEKQWMRDNKPQGFDVLDLRFGGTMHRLNSCRRRILDYVNDKVDSIPELEEKLLPYPNSMKEESCMVYHSLDAMSANVL